MNTIIVLAIVSVTALFVYWQWRTWRMAKRCEGQAVPDTTAIDGGVVVEKRIYYFYSPHCGPCKAISPQVDTLREEFPNLIKVDVTENMDLAQAFSIAATPSFILVSDGVVREVKLGGVSASWLRERLTV